MNQKRKECLDWVDELEKHGTEVRGIVEAINECDSEDSLDHLSASLSWVVNALNGTI